MWWLFPNILFLAIKVQVLDVQLCLFPKYILLLFMQVIFITIPGNSALKSECDFVSVFSYQRTYLNLVPMITNNSVRFICLSRSKFLHLSWNLVDVWDGRINGCSDNSFCFHFSKIQVYCGGLTWSGGVLSFILPF